MFSIIFCLCFFLFFSQLVLLFIPNVSLLLKIDSSFFKSFILLVDCIFSFFLLHESMFSSFNHILLSDLNDQIAPFEQLSKG